MYPSVGIHTHVHISITHTRAYTSVGVHTHICIFTMRTQGVFTVQGLWAACKSVCIFARDIGGTKNYSIILHKSYRG